MQQKSKALKHGLKPLIVTPNGALFVCHYCELIVNEKLVTKDHITPKSGGGENKSDNYCPSCQKCNLLKADIPYEKFMQIISEFGTDIIRIETPDGATNHNIVEGGVFYHLSCSKPKVIMNNQIGFGSRILTTVTVKTKLYIFLSKKK